METLKKTEKIQTVEKVTVKAQKLTVKPQEEETLVEVDATQAKAIKNAAELDKRQKADEKLVKTFKDSEKLLHAPGTVFVYKSQIGQIRLAQLKEQPVTRLNFAKLKEKYPEVYGDCQEEQIDVIYKFC